VTSGVQTSPSFCYPTCPAFYLVDIYTPILDPTVTWKTIEWMRSFTKLPILAKGVLNPDDAELAIKAGTSGIMVSNHGAAT